MKYIVIYKISSKMIFLVDNKILGGINMQIQIRYLVDNKIS